jgi:hypothetical protein
MAYVVFSAMAVSAICAPSALAGWLAADADRCDEQRLSQPFKPWLDPLSYTPVRDGGVERRGDGWRLTGDARAVWGNEPWTVAGDDGDRSLAIPEGSSATTPAMCVGLEEPTLRFFARASGATISYLDVEVLYEDALGRVQDTWIGHDLGGRWHPTAAMPIGVNLLPLLPGEKTAVAFRFTARLGDFQIDDAFVDPWSQR